MWVLYFIKQLSIRKNMGECRFFPRKSLAHVRIDSRSVRCQLLASVILGIALCSIKTESWPSTSTSPVFTLSTCMESLLLASWLVVLLFPESNRNCLSSFWKKFWNPSCAQSIIRSLNFANNSRSPLRSCRNS